MKMKRIIFERKRRGWSQAKLSQVAEINQTTVCKLEKGKAYLWPAWGERIARALEWDGDPSELLEEVEVEIVVNAT